MTVLNKQFNNINDLNRDDTGLSGITISSPLETSIELISGSPGESQALTHNSLRNIQGGITEARYHLSLTEYNSLMDFLESNGGSIVEFANVAAFPATGEDLTIYIALDTNLAYRWSGTIYVEISASLALGETEATAYRGDRGKTAYDHSQATHAPSDAEVNVQADWSQSDNGQDDFIKNKPIIPGDYPPNGVDSDVQYRKGDIFAGDINLQYDDASVTLKIGTDITILPDNPLAIQKTVDSYLQVNLQNLSDGVDASSDYIVTADTGDDTQGYGDFGIGNSGYASEAWDVVGPIDTYLFGDGGNIAIGSLTPGKEVKVFIAQTEHEAHPEDVVTEFNSDGINLPVNKTLKAHYIQYNSNPTKPAFANGQQFYDATNKTIATRISDGVTLQHGQESHVICYNNTGSTILNGKVVYILGAVGNFPSIALAKADQVATSDGRVLGMATQDIADGETGLVTNFGKVNDLDTSSWASGTILYLSETTAGDVTSTPPISPYSTIKLGYVISQHATTGNILIHISFAGNLDDIIDVTITNPQEDQILKYNGTNWINGESVAANAGAGVNYFYDMSASDIGGYYSLQKTPADETEDDNYVVCNNNEVAIETFASPLAGLGGTQIDAGVWSFNIWGYVDTISGGDSSVDIDVYKRTSGGTETLLFSINSGILSASLDLYTVESAQQSYAINSTDRLIIKLYGKTTATANRNVHFVHAGTTHYSYVNTPLVVRHNDLIGIQGGTSGDYQHLTTTELGYIHAPHSDDQVIPDELADLSDDATHRLVTDTEKSTWNSKSDLALGELSSDAYRGDRGKTAYDHSQATHAPSNAEQNVQADWNEADSGADDFIKNKPSIPAGVTPGDTVANEITFGITPAAGAATSFSRSDHTHGTPANPGGGGVTRSQMNSMIIAFGV
jgi:hypothetical protein